MDILRAGSIWAGCEIVKLLGSGGFAQVYEVRDRAGARRALKVLDAEAGLGSKLQARLAQEGEALAMIEHVNVLRFYEAGIQDDRVWLLLELVEGVSLRELEDACGGRPPLESVLRWVRQACDGLAAAHAQGVVHRDVKPENLLVTPTEVVKVIDFGLAKLNGWGVKTTQQHLLGTAFYMAPEQLRSKPADPRMDIYAMGLVLYEAIAGIHPIEQLGGPLTMIAVCGRQLTYTPPPLRSLRPEVPGDLSELVQRMIDKDPARRVASMGEIAARLQDVLARLLVHRRSAVRELPLPGREVGMQRTIPMQAQQEVPIVPRGPHGTTVLHAVDAPPSQIPAAPPSARVSLPEDVRLTGDRAALMPPVTPARRRPWWPLAVVVFLVMLGVAVAWFGVWAFVERRDIPPVPRHR